MTVFEFKTGQLSKVDLKEEQIIELTNTLDFETIETWGTNPDTLYPTFSIVVRRKDQNYVVLLTYHEMDHVVVTEGLINYAALIAWIRDFAEDCIALETLQTDFRNVMDSLR